jgi:LPXTG-motif cell wall-anchored protein
VVEASAPSEPAAVAGVNDLRPAEVPTLPRTGSSAGLDAAAGVALVAIGALLLVVVRRPRRTSVG